MSGAGGGGGDTLLTVTVVRDEHGYGMKVSGDNPVYVQSVKEHGAAWRAGLRAGDRILRVDNVPVHHHTHQQVVLMIRANPTTVLTVHQNLQRQKTPITAPLPVNSEKQRQLDFSKMNTVRLMLEKEQKYIHDLRSELTKVPDVRIQAHLEQAERRCAELQRELDRSGTAQPGLASPATPRPNRHKEKPDKPDKPDKDSPPSGFLSGLPRSLSNLTGQSLRNLRQKQKTQQENQPPIVRQNSDDAKRRHNNTVPIVPTTCLDNSPPPLPPRTIRNPLSPNLTPINPLAKPRASSSVSPAHKFNPKSPMHQSMHSYRDSPQFRRSSHSLDGDLEGPQPNSIALQMSYPLVNAPPPPLQLDNRGAVMHVRSQSSPEHLDQGALRNAVTSEARDGWSGAPPPGTPPPPYAHNTQPCADPQRAIISMEEDDSPASDTTSFTGLFSNLRSVRESKARIAVLLNWLLIERRCAYANLLLLITDGYRAAGGVGSATLRRWAYEIQSTFLMPNAVLQLSGVDENIANEIEHVLANEYEKEELLRNVFRKARQKAKDELAQQLTEFQVKRQVGLGSLYGPEDSVLEKCDVDKAQEQVVVERLLSARLQAVARTPASEAQAALLAALVAAAHALSCRPSAIAASVGGARETFLQRDKVYKQRLKQLAKQVPQPFIVRGHHMQLQALTSVAHCHLCDHVVWGLAPQAYTCTDCKLRVHLSCARSIEESCCLDGESQAGRRISRFIDRIHHNNQPNNQDYSDKKSRKSATSHFLNMERSIRKSEDDSTMEHAVPTNIHERRDESDESLYESADGHSDTISASDDALPRLSKTPTMSKESLKLAVTDEEVDGTKMKRGHRKAMSLSNPLELVKNLDWLEAKKDIDKNWDKKKSRESLWSEEDRESINGSTLKLDQIRKNSKKDDKPVNSRKNSAELKRKSTKGHSVSALNLFRRKKTQVVKPADVVTELNDKVLSHDEILSYTKFFLEEEKRHSEVCESKPVEVSDSEEEVPLTPRATEHRRRLSRQASRSKSKVRGKSQSVKVNTLRKSHSGTLKKNKKKGVKTPLVSRSRQTSIVELTPMKKKKSFEHSKQTAWLFSSARGESKREGSSEEPAAAEADADSTDTKDLPDKDNNWRTAPPTGRGVNRAESCRERDAPRRGKHRNASDPNRLTAHNNHDLEPGAATAPSGSSSSSSLSSRSNESNTVTAEQQASQSDWSEEDEPLAAQWADSLPPQVLDTLLLSGKLRKRQEVIHELIVSEGSHVRWLKVLGFVFWRSLESVPTLLPPEELRALFPNLPAVRERHSRLYAELRTIRANNHLVQIRPVADAVLNMLGEAGYAHCLSRFCRAQRMSLDNLRERRRKHKELHQFLCAREQLPLCGRLQLRDLLACVWQRLTKYQLLLENILATVSESDESEADVAQLKLALNTAKEVLHSVDTAIRTAENQHRLKSIQSKLEVRAGAAEWEELKRLDLTTHNLKMEGELSIRNDSNKKINVLALMLDDILVLLQREGDKFILKPITQPSQQGLLSPVIRWDKVLFRPNAAVRNTFFLMNINGVQMHELSTNTTSEYTNWVKHIQEVPLAKLTELKLAVSQTRTVEDSGTAVSRNPSDASEKSDKSEVDTNLPSKEDTPLSENSRLNENNRTSENSRLSENNSRLSENSRLSGDRTETPERGVRESSIESPAESEERKSEDRERTPRRPTVGRISTHSEGSGFESGALQAASVAPSVQAYIATTAITVDERLRRLDNRIAGALREKSTVVAELVGATPDSLNHLADLALADTLGLVDVNSELRATRSDLDQDLNLELDRSGEETQMNVHQLLLAAYTQANQLTEQLSQALSASPARQVSLRARRSVGHCDTCRHRNVTPATPAAASEPPVAIDSPEARLPNRLSTEASFDMLSELNNSCYDESLDGNTAASLATRLLPINNNLQQILARLMTSLPAERQINSARAELAAERDCTHALRASLRHYQNTSVDIPEPDDETDPTIQEQSNNGG